jgi:hypothetical protein
LCGPVLIPASQTFELKMIAVSDKTIRARMAIFPQLGAGGSKTSSRARWTTGMRATGSVRLSLNLAPARSSRSDVPATRFLSKASWGFTFDP